MMCYFSVRSMIKSIKFTNRVELWTDFWQVDNICSHLSEWTCLMENSYFFFSCRHVTHPPSHVWDSDATPAFCTLKKDFFFLLRKSLTKPALTRSGCPLWSLSDKRLEIIIWLPWIRNTAITDNNFLVVFWHIWGPTCEKGPTQLNLFTSFSQSTCFPQVTKKMANEENAREWRFPFFLSVNQSKEIIIVVSDSNSNGHCAVFSIRWRLLWTWAWWIKVHYSGKTL